MRALGPHRYTGAMHALFLVAALAAQPQPSSTPLKTIVNIRSREMCTVLRENFAPAIAGVLANDKLASEGQALLNRLGSDAQDEYADDLGGAGAAASMDNLRVENIVSGLVANIAKLDELLDGAQYRGSEQSDAATVAAARSRLEAVLAQQKAELNVLSFVTYSNQGRDLQEKRDPTGSAFNTPPPSLQSDIPPVALPHLLAVLRTIERGAEDAASRALTPIIQTCR